MNTKFLTRIATILLTSVIFSGLASAQQMNYQGRLTDASGNALADGNYNLRFNVYTVAASGSALWGPSDVAATLVNGRFNVILGEPDDTTLGASGVPRKLKNAFTSSTPHYLGITLIDAVTNPTNLEIAPRQQILSSPNSMFANTAGHATTATAVGNPGEDNAINIVSGKVGIGTENPAAKLDVVGDARFSGGISMYNGLSGIRPLSATTLTNEIHGGRGPGFDAGQLRLSAGHGSSGLKTAIDLYGHPDNSILFHTAGGERMRILGSGNVGIGQPNPTVKLDVNGVIRAYDASLGAPSIGVNGGSGQRLILWPGQATTTPFGFGINSQTLWSAVPNGAIHAWYTNTTERMRISESGSVGIGTSSPTQAKLVVIGGGNVNLAAYQSFVNGGLTGVNPAGVKTDISIYATKMAADEFRAFSDARMKTIQGRSDGTKDLAMLTALEITDYHYKDAVAKGNQPQKKVIAQQVETVYPQAVSQMTDAVPDIYQSATVANGWVTLTTDLKKGERVRLIGEKKEGIHEVLEVKEGQFRTDFEADTDEVFVFGREVNDFRTVDYEAIAMLNVSATQELHRQLTAKSEEISTLEQRLAALEAKDKARDERCAKLERLLEGASTVIPVSID